ncbi:MAG: metal-dependent hydrolase [Halobacteriota archaeon]
MMSPTHIGVGIALAVPLLWIDPELAVAAALGGMAGGILPDLDLFVGTHRKTLHFPVYYWIPAIAAAILAVVSTGPATIAIAYVFLSAAIHSVMDWFGAGDEPRPWLRTSAEAVYVHPRDRWLPPKYWIRYDGAPEDLALSVGLAIPGIVMFGSPISELATATVVVALLYGVVRKLVPEYFGDLI